MADVKQFITEQRAKGIPELQIYKNLQESGLYAGVQESTASQADKFQQSITQPRTMSREVVPTIGSVAGGVLGAAAGAPLGPVGVAAGGALGSGLGASAGEFLQQVSEIGAGGRKDISTPQIAATGVISAAVPAALSGAGAGVRAVAPSIRKPIIATLGKLSSYSEDVVQKILEQGQGVKTGVIGGEKALTDLIKRANEGLKKYSKQAQDEFGAGLEKVYKETKTTHKENLVKLRDFSKQIITELKNNRIDVTKKGLVFDRPDAPSRITSTAEQKNISEATKLVQSLGNNTSPQHIEAVLERITALKEFDTTTGKQTSAIVSKLKEIATNAADSLYPEIGKIRADYATKKETLDAARDFIPEKLTPKNITTSTGKLYQLYNTGRLEAREALEKVGGEIKEDITGTVAGAITKGKEAYSFRAAQLGERKSTIISKLVAALPDKVIKNFAETGKISKSPESKTLQRTMKTLNVSASAVRKLMENMFINKDTQ